jgi:orotate phosphoribosyltransferase
MITPPAPARQANQMLPSLERAHLPLSGCSCSAGVSGYLAQPETSGRIIQVSADDLTQLAREVDARCRLRGRFTLRSGQVSNEYFDKYLFESDPALLRRVTEVMTGLLPADTELLGGLELGGLPLATVLSQMTGIPVLFVRKQAKSYGTRRLAEGGDPTARIVTLIEDVVTTGGAVISAARALRELGATVTTAVCAIDRSPSGASMLADEGIAVKSVLTKALLDTAAKNTQPSSSAADSLR